MNGLRDLLRELHRRSLWQVLGVYLAGSWLALQVVETIAESLGLPPWVRPFAVVLLVLGLPMVMATAIVQEGTPASGKGAGRKERRTAQSHRAVPAPHHRVFTWRNAVLGGVGAFALWGVVSAGWLMLGNTNAAGGDADTPSYASIAVLPFATVHTDEQSRAFVAGIHDDLLTQLAKIDSLTVISRTSVLQYQDTKRPIKEIARELGVAAVLEGGVQRSGDRVRINVQLIAAGTDAHLWAETYDEQLSAANVFAIQSDLAQKIARALHARLSPETTARIEGRPTENLTAYDLETRGRYVLQTQGNTKAGMESALGLFKAAVAADPDYAPAHLGVALLHYRLFAWGYAPEQGALPAARAALDHAIQLDPDLAEAYALRATLLRDEDLPAAEAAARRALALKPGSAEVHRAYARVLVSARRPHEALAAARRALELDPHSLEVRRTVLDYLIAVGRYDEAIEGGRKLRKVAPTDADLAYTIAGAWILKRDYERGIAEYRRALDLIPEDPYYPTALAWALARAGRRTEAREALGQAEHNGAPLKEFAIVYGELGELDTAYDYLGRALIEEPRTLSYLHRDFMADSLRADQRWQAFANKLQRRNRN